MLPCLHTKITQRNTLRGIERLIKSLQSTLMTIEKPDMTIISF